MELKEIGCEGVDCIDLAQDKDKWLAFVKAVMKVQFYKMQGISRLAEEPLPFEEDSVTWSQLSTYGSFNDVMVDQTAQCRILWLGNNELKG